MNCGCVGPVRVRVAGAAECEGKGRGPGAGRESPFARNPCAGYIFGTGGNSFPGRGVSRVRSDVNPDDRRSIDACRAGSPGEFNELVRRYQDRLFHSVLRVVDNPEDAADVVQDSFVNAFQSLASFKGDSEFFTWLFRIAFNAAISHKRRTRATVSLGAGRYGEAIPDPADDAEGIQPHERIERTEDEARLHAALNRLSPDHRVAIVLKDLDGMKYEEMAEVLGVAVGTVRSRLNRARLELRQILETDGHG